MTATLQEAKDLHATYRAEYVWAVRVSLAKALLSQPEVHADDVEVPPDARNVIGTVMASFAARKWMEETGERRTSRRRSTNARKSSVYRITDLGRRKLASTPVPATPPPGGHGTGTSSEDRDRRRDAVEAAFERFVAEDPSPEWVAA